MNLNMCLNMKCMLYKGYPGIYMYVSGMLVLFEMCTGRNYTEIGFVVDCEIIFRSLETEKKLVHNS